MGQSHFLRVEIIMSEATYFVVFTETHSLPPPFRVDNFSLVPITYFQVRVCFFFLCLRRTLESEVGAQPHRGKKRSVSLGLQPNVRQNPSVER